MNNTEIKNILADIYNNDMAFKFLPKELSLDKKFIRKAFIVNYGISRYFDENIKSDIDFISELIKINGRIISLIPQYLNNRLMVVNALSTYGSLLYVLPEHFQSDEECVTHAVTNYGCSLDAASFELKVNEKICLLAVTNNGEALAYCINPSKNIVHTAIKQCGINIKYTPLSYRSDLMTIVYALSTTNFKLLRKNIIGEFKDETKLFNRLKEYSHLLSINIRNFYYFMFSRLPIEINRIIGEYYDIKVLKDNEFYCLKAIKN